MPRKGARRGDHVWTGRMWEYNPRPRRPMPASVKATLAARGADDARWARWLRMWARIGLERVKRATPADVWQERPRWLLDAALADYKIMYPAARGERLYVKRAVPGHPHLANYVCRFCGHVVGSGGMGWWGTPQGVAEHTEACALECLAGVRSPVPPGFNPTDPATLALAIEQLVAVTRACVLAWASDVVDDSMRRFANLEL